jgi:hypothetical protein
MTPSKYCPHPEDKIYRNAAGKFVCAVCGTEADSRHELEDKMEVVECLTK